MIVELKTENMYGTQNNDISKKNKFDKINIPLITIGEAKEDDFVSISVDTDSAENELFKIATSGSATDLPDKTGTSVQYSSKFPFYIANIKSKIYYVTIDSTDSRYNNIKNIRVIPDFNGKLQNGKRYFLNTDSSGSSGLTGWGDTKYEGDMFETALADFDLIGKLENLTTDGWYGTTSWEEENSFNNEIYSITEDSTTVEHNVNSEIIQFVQDGVNAIPKTDNSFKTALDYMQPSIIKWTNSANQITMQIRCPYEICILETQSGYQAMSLSSLIGGHNVYTIGFDSAELSMYTVSNSNVSILISYETSTNTISFYDGNREFNADSSDLFTDGIYFKEGSSVITTEYPEYFANKIYERYKDGKLILKLKYPVSKITDTLGGNVVYIENYGISKEDSGNFFTLSGDIININETTKITYDVPLQESLMCIITKNGESIYKNADGSDKLFVIQNANISYTGIAINETELIESSQTQTQFYVVYSQPEHSTITVENSYQGTLPSGSLIKANYIDIYAEFDEGYGLVDNLMNINGKDVELSAWGAWQVYPTSDVIIKPNVVYLGGKYLHITKDDDCELTMFVGSSSNTIEDGDEIFTNQTITINGKISSNLTPRILVNGVQQKVESYAGYDFYLNIEVKDTDINVVIQTQSLARTLTVNIDEDAIADYSQAFLKVYSSEYNPDSVDEYIYNNGSVYLEDKVVKYTVSLNSGYSITNSTISGLEDVGGNLLKVIDNVVLDYETTLTPVKCTLYIFKGDISYIWNKYDGYNITVTRISSKAGGELGEITAFSGQLSQTIDGETVTRTYTGYDVLVQDEISIKIEMINRDTGIPEFVDTTITATRGLTSSSSVQFENGQSFKIDTSAGYSISATIE